MDPKYRSFPRIVIFDSKTRGIGEYHLELYRHPPKYTESDDNSEIMDYRLAVIDIVNRSQDSMDNEASLLSFFVEMMIQNKNNQVLYHIITSIQSLLLHHSGINIIYKFYGYSANVIFKRRHESELEDNTKCGPKLTRIRKYCLRPFIVLKRICAHYCNLISSDMI